MEKTIEGVVYQLVESPEPLKGMCEQCEGNRTQGLCLALGAECCSAVNKTKVWLIKEKSDES
ncbi:hypothetical protein [Aeromonas phage PVN02]|nr:hypothetical protein [Aeromonas phage PVN02]QTQ06863.1 hypothetical protein [Aeromonas phage PVN04]QTQ06930.1 hypothetical protein [Aeromonas phage PVN05]CAC9972315.1 hypothetical protein PVN02_00048 [Aeromonas phage PVN02]